jgi:hypothetical protein
VITRTTLEKYEFLSNTNLPLVLRVREAYNKLEIYEIIRNIVI